MKKYFRLGFIIIFMVAAFFIVQAKEDKIHFKKRFSKNKVYIEPPGLRVAKRPKQPFMNGYELNRENSPIAIHPGWPKTFAYVKLGGYFYWPGPGRMIESDLDGDSKGEIVIAPEPWNKGLIFKENGDVLNGFFMPQVFDETLSVGDIDNNKKKEIVTLSSTDDMPLYFYIFNCFGNLKLEKNLYPNVGMYMPILADLNNNRKDEIIIKTGIIGQTTLQILDSRGDIISEFCTKIDENVGSIFTINPIIADFDNDVYLEIVVPLWHIDNDENFKTYIEIYNLDGTPVPGWENVAVPELIYNPVCGDLNGDGQDEIVACGWDKALYILDSNGQLILNKNFSNGMPCGSPAIGDINNDGKPEIIFHLFNNWLPTSLLAVDWQGKIVLKKEISKHAMFSPLIGDMNGDGIPDIVFGNDDYIYAFNWQRKNISGFPIKVNGNGFFIYGPGPSICDIDHDGKIEITYTKDNCDSNEFSLYVLDVDSPYNPTTMEWPMYQHDPGHSGRYVRNITVTSPNGGENWVVGTIHNITWKSIRTIAKVRIEVSTNSGSSWSVVIAATVNDGSLAWTVPDTPSHQCLVRISDAANGAVKDTSNAVFSVLMNLDLQVERRTAKAFSIVRYYGQIQFLAGNGSEAVAQYKIMRRKDNGDFLLLRAVAPSELQNGKFQMQDKYLEKDIAYTYQVEAYNTTGHLIGISLEKTI